MRKLAVLMLLAFPAMAEDGHATCHYTFSEWSACLPSGIQTRTVLSSSPPSCTGVPNVWRPCTPSGASCTPPQEPDAQGQCRTPLALMTCEIRIQYAQGTPQNAAIVSAGADYCDAKGIERALIKSLSDVAE